MPQETNNYLFGTVFFFIAVFSLIALDIRLENRGIVIAVIFMIMIAEYCGIQWIIDKRILEKNMKKEKEIKN